MASRYQSNIAVGRDDMVVNAKSVLGVMTLAAECGAELLIRAEGSDAEAAIGALTALVRNGFRE